jgi:hypothetical protein
MTRSGNVAKITTPRSLQKIPAHTRHIANLRRSALQKGLRNDRIIGDDFRMKRHPAHFLESADSQPIYAHFDAAHRQRVHVHQTRRLHHFQLHQINHRRPARDKQGIWSAA